jgi:3-dehydroquinate synthase
MMMLHSQAIHEPSKDCMTIAEIRVELGERSYSISIGADSSCILADRLQKLFPKSRHLVLIYDKGVDAWQRKIANSLSEASFQVTSIPVPSGEQSKCVQQLADIWQRMLAARTDRGSVVIALGGGVIGDLAGFAAASFARGLPLVQIPTTLLSQVDSSVGGKTGINLPDAKNMVGAFWQPSLVVIDCNSLTTLPQREYVSGIAEIVKYGVILLPELFEYLEANANRILMRDMDCLQHIILQSCRAKAQVVQKDERETTGLRAILNYGHTFAHAIEATEGYGKYLHGEAVSIGMNMAAHLGLRLGRVDKAFVDRQSKLMKALQLPTRMPSPNAEVLWKAMQSDKKVEHGTLRFILPKCMGQVELVPGVEAELAMSAIVDCQL